MEDIRFDESGNIIKTQPETAPKKKRWYLSAAFISVAFCVIYLALWTWYSIETMECWEGTYRKVGESGSEVTVSLEKLDTGDYALEIACVGTSVDGSISAVLPKEEMVGRDAEFTFQKDGEAEYVHIFMERENLLQLTYVFPYEEGMKVKRIRPLKIKQVK